MAWGRIDDRLWAHPKTGQAGLPAMGLWVCALSYSMDYLTEGHISAETVRKIGGKPSQVRSLLEAGFWAKCEEHPRCHVFHDWDQYHPSKAQILADREATAERVKAWREKKNQGK